MNPNEMWVAASKVLWQSIVPNATYHSDWGIEKAWRSNYEQWGYPLEAGEITISYQGKSMNARTFHRVGIVAWDPSKGPVIVGKPE